MKKNRLKYASKDFEEKDLPFNRARQFFELLKIEKRTMFKIGLILAAFSLLFFVASIARWFVTLTYKEALKAAEATDTQKQFVTNIISLIYYALLTPVFMIISIGLAGTSRIIQNLVYGEGVLFKEDFVKGIKLNLKQFLIISLVYGIFAFFAGANKTFFSGKDLLSQIISGLSLGLFYGIITPLIFFMLTQTVIYKIDLGKNLKNSYRIMIASFGYALIFVSIIFGVTILSRIEIIDPILGYGIELLIVLILGPWFYLAWHMFAFSRFDKYINKQYYREIYRKGLSKDIDE